VSGLLISVAVLPAGDGMCSVVVLSGEADMTCVELREGLAAEVAKKPRLIAVDMSALTFIHCGCPGLAAPCAGRGRSRWLGREP